MIELTTQCPQCDYRFDVTLEQLQQRKGLLRCAKCAHIFDAYECAVDNQVGLGVKKTPTISQVTPKVKALAPHLRWHFIGERPLSTGVAAIAPVIPTRARTQSPMTSSQPIQSTVDSSVSDIRVYLDRDEKTERIPPAFSMPSSLNTEPHFSSGDENAHFTFTPEPRSSSYKTTSSAQPSGWMQGVWALLFWFLLLVLGLQLLYVYRAQIANTVGFSRPVLQLMCDLADCKIPYMREINAIEIKQSALQQQPNTGTTKQYSYFLQLQLKNNLNWAQEWPTLIVSFSDASAAVMATVAIAPDQYLAPSQRQRPFGAAEQYSVRVPVSLANKRINGFTVEKYYP